MWKESIQIKTYKNETISKCYTVWVLQIKLMHSCIDYECQGQIKTGMNTKWDISKIQKSWKLQEKYSLFRFWYLKNVFDDTFFSFSFYNSLANARKIQDGIVSNSLVYFTSHTPPPSQGVMAPAPLKLRRILDMVCINLIHA